jgi:transposase-like protein
MTKQGQGSRGGRRVRRAFSTEYKAEAVRLVTERRAAGASLTQIARELEVRPDLLRQWIRAFPATDGAPTGETPQQELQRLRRENAVLRQEQAFAKKVAVYFAKESR